MSVAILALQVERDRAFMLTFLSLFLVCVGVMTSTPLIRAVGLQPPSAAPKVFPPLPEEHAAAMRRDAEDSLLRCQVIANDSSKNVFARSVV